MRSWPRTASPAACPSSGTFRARAIRASRASPRDISVNQGETVHFKVNTDATAYRLDIYRLGYYGGDGARQVATVSPTAPLPQTQPACLNEAATGLVDCGNWAVSASWAGPGRRGLGHLLRQARPRRRHRRARATSSSSCATTTAHSDLLFQTSDTTWQAYNHYGGNSLYTGGPGTNPGARLQGQLQPPVHDPRDRRPRTGSSTPSTRWSAGSRRNGYDVSYITGVDTDRRGAELLEQHKVFMSVGHDEYWSGDQRANVEAARDAGVNLAFFSGNEVFWKTRWEPSIDGSAPRPHARLLQGDARQREDRPDRARGPAPGGIRVVQPATAAGPRTR